jgi:hypothetical protein
VSRTGPAGEHGVIAGVADASTDPVTARSWLPLVWNVALLALLGLTGPLGELVDQIVHRVARVAFDPAEPDGTVPHDLDERLPQVAVGDGFR